MGVFRKINASGNFGGHRRFKVMHFVRSHFNCADTMLPQQSSLISPFVAIALSEEEGQQTCTLKAEIKVRDLNQLGIEFQAGQA